ncbi:hypothetical protein M8J76_008121 [Diaphorina citri]|nr:hypothetical protein M8J76_008121 [Diaphorina citri]
MDIDLCLVSEPNIQLSMEWGGYADAKIWRTPKLTFVESEGDGNGFTWAVIGGILFISLYSSFNDPIFLLESSLKDISEKIRAFSGEAVVGGDFNAKSPLWNESRTDQRGLVVSEWIANENLVIQNKGFVPTYRARGFESIIDLTLTTEGLGDRISSWEVIDTENASDHNYIYFEISISPPPPVISKLDAPWNPRTLNVNRLKEIIRNTNVENINTVEELMEFLNDTCSLTMKRKGNGRRKEVHWWTEEIHNLRKECNRKRRRYTRNVRRCTIEQSEQLYNEYREARSLMNLEIVKSKKRCWSEICEDLNRDIWGLAYKIVTRKIGRKSPEIPPNIRQAVIESLFPNHPVTKWEYTRERGPNITVEELAEVILKTKNNKAPGPDGIPGVLLKETILAEPNLFLKIFNNIMGRGEFPKSWKRARVVLLEKPKKNREDQLSYRPICLLDTLGKVYEGILNHRLNIELEEKNILSDNQFGFRKKKSTVHAIQAVVALAKEEMNKNYRKRKLCIMITLDIKNAFNSAPWVEIVRALKRCGISKYLVDLIQDYLSEREIVGETFTKSMTAGVPQGSLSGPSLWNILYNDVLEIPVPEDVFLVAYADDLSVLVKGIDEETLEQKAQVTLNRIEAWMLDRGLTIAPEKSEMIALIGRKKCRPLNIQINGNRICEKPNIKYLGVILDKSLRFGAHMDHVASKAARVTTALSRIMPRIGGPGEQKRRLRQDLGEALTPDNMVPLMLSNINTWDLIVKYINQIMETKTSEERARENGNRRQCNGRAHHSTQP